MGEEKRRKGKKVCEGGCQLRLPSGAREVCEHALIFGQFIEEGLIISEQFIEINAVIEMLSIVLALEISSLELNTNKRIDLTLQTCQYCFHFTVSRQWVTPCCLCSTFDNKSISDFNLEQPQ